MNCSKCGKKILPEDKYCRYCGNVVENKDNTLAIISLILGILSVTVGILIIPIGIIGLILGISQKSKSGIRTAGIVLNSIGLALSIIVILVILGIFKLTKSIITNNDLKEYGEKFVIGGDFSEEKYEDWEKYIELGKDNISHEKGLEGSWRLLGDGNDFMVFENGHFKYYKDYNDKENNVINGSYKFTDLGEESYGIVRRIFNFINKKSNAIGIYFLTLLPNNNIEDDVQMYESTWLIVNHGEEGYEAKVKIYDLDGEEKIVNDNFVKVIE